MIKAGKYIKINPLTILLFLICIFSGQIKLFTISYMTIFLHEMAHFFAAYFLGLKTDNITFHPFGVNLQLKNKIVCGLSDEIILYGAGPLFNIVCAGILSLMGVHTDLIDYFYTCNIVLFFINILPILPLDGGVILKKTLSYILGYKKSQNILLCLSVILICIIVLIEIVCAYKSGVNYSVVIMILFLLGNIFTQREKYNVDFLNELMFYQKKNTDKGRIIIAYDDLDYKEIAKKFKKGNYSVIMFINDNGEITKTMTEKQIMNILLS